MMWAHDKNGDVITIKTMSNSKLKSSLNWVQTTNLIKMHGFSKSYCLLELQKEINYRKQLENSILSRLPFIQEKVETVKQRDRLMDKNAIKYRIRFKSDRANKFNRINIIKKLHQTGKK